MAHEYLKLVETARVTSHFDGEGRFGRGRNGQITHFIYYEFGKRLGKAKRLNKVASGAAHA